ncbi:MAG: methyltransferase domain-containing protein [Actinomycetota bacterium]
MGIFRRRDDAGRPSPGAEPARGTSRGARVEAPYDAIAEAFDRGDAANTLQVARDLVAALGVRAGERMLDVGTGTGVVPQAVADAAPEANVVGADASVGMLSVGVARGRLARAVAAMALDLPFRDQIFDVETANFVISHFRRLDTALFDMRRVLRVGGRLGVTSWVPSPDEFDRAWVEVAERYAGREILQDARGQIAPAEERVGDPSALRDILYAAGFRKIDIQRRGYRFEWERDAFLANRNEIRGARYMRRLLGEALWERFQQDVAAVYRERFPERLGDSVDVLIAVCRREN